MSLGFHHGNNNDTQKRQRAVSKRPISISPEPEPEMHTPSRRSSLTTPLVGLNLVLCVAHLAAAITAATYDIRYPLTVFETRIKAATIDEFACKYEYTKDDDGDYYCSDESLVLTRNYSDTGSCTPHLQNETDNIFQNEDGSPQLNIYELRTFTLGSNSSKAVADEGRRATRWFLFTIESVTALFHLVYAVIFVQMRWFDETGAILKRVMVAGGLPCRWYEYAITASLMSFFISNNAAVYDVYALVGIGLATFAAMFFGMLIEFMLYSGRSRVALMLLYIPGFALFAAGWVGSIRQLFTNVADMSCRDDDDVFSCAKTCFGEQVPIPMFVFVLLLLFVLFPLILLYKIYVVGGWQAKLTRPIFGGFDLVCRRRSLPQSVLRLAFEGLAFGVFVALGMVVAVYSLLIDCLWPLHPSLAKEHVEAVDEAVKLSAFWRGELLYALASATSKLFLFIYFMVVFSQREW